MGKRGSFTYKQIISLKLLVAFCLLFLSFQNCQRLPSEQISSQETDNTLSDEYKQNELQLLLNEQKMSRVEILKTRSCMFDSLLFPETSSFSDNISMLKNSNCLFLPRVVETWNTPPNFSKIQQNKNKVENSTGRSFIYGMFIAESISVKSKYSDSNGRPFDFSKMCREQTLGYWGEQTCIPNVNSNEFKKYLFYIFKEALNNDISDFLFGQLAHLDPEKALPSIIFELKQIAQKEGKEITIGGQPNGIMEDRYLRSFDYLITPSYLGDTHTETCKGYENNCSAHYFREDIYKKYDNIIAEIDWSSKEDDVHRLGSLPQEIRHDYIYYWIQELKKKNIGFILPYNIYYNHGSLNSCKGTNQWVYSASNNFECNDEESWNQIMLNTYIPKNKRDVIDLEVAKQFVTNGYLNIMGRSEQEVSNDNQGFKFWVNKLLQNTSYMELKEAFLASDEYYIRGLFKTILKRNPDTEGVNYYISQIENGNFTREEVKADLIYACENNINNECT